MPSATHFRLDPRTPLALPVTLRCAAHYEPMAAHMKDLSLGGARLATKTELPAGSCVTLEIHAPTRWDPVVLPGVVVWSRPRTEGTDGSIGVRFDLSHGTGVLALLELLRPLP